MVERLKPKSLASMAQKVSDRFALAERSVTRGNSEDNSKIVNQTQRFELWAKNLGLYHLGHSSLDYRFRDAPSLFEYTAGLLRNLEGLLVQLIGTLNPGHLSSVDTINKINLSIGSHEQFSDNSEEDDFESSDDESIADLLLGSVTATVDKLYRLSFKIRNPAMRLGFSKSLKYHEFDPETGVNLIDEFRENDQRHIEQLFASYRSIPPANFERDFLVQRLAKANTRRRQQFRYWKKRRAQSETSSKTETINKIATGFIPRESEISPNLNVPVVPIAPSRPSTATHLDVSKVKLEDNASIVSSSTVADMKDEGNGDCLFIPPPPNHLWDEEEFECPYCFTLCPRKMLRQTDWKIHVLRDLRPYICTYKDCRDADQQYDRLGDWINHETFAHQRKSDIISSENGKLSIQEPRKCPFCLEDAGPQHIATHLRRVACFSLPRSIGSDDGSSQGSQVSGRADIRSNSTRVSGIRSQASFGGAESVSEVGREVNLQNNLPLTLEYLYQQQPDPKDKESKVNRFLERLESEYLGIDITKTDDIDPTSISDRIERTANFKNDAIARFENPILEECTEREAKVEGEAAEKVALAQQLVHDPSATKSMSSDEAQASSSRRRRTNSVKFQDQLPRQSQTQLVSVQKASSPQRDPRMNGILVSPCPRSFPVSGQQDWYTLKGLTHLDVCPSCMDQISNSRFRDFFIRSTPKPPTQETRCAFANAWVRLSWAQMMKKQHDSLELLYQMTRPPPGTRPCPGRTVADQAWHRIVDPYTGSYLPHFHICGRCARNVRILMPSHRDTFQPCPDIQERVCDFVTTSSRFVKYIDLLDIAASRADSSHRPDTRDFLAYARRKVALRDCRLDRPTMGTWHYIPALPELSVCEDCYDDVVWPLVKVHHPIARSFSTSMRRLPGDVLNNCHEASCQLYSPRMRAKFREAVSNNDFSGLKAATLRRIEAEKIFRDRREELLVAVERGYDCKEELTKAVEEWKRWE